MHRRLAAAVAATILTLALSGCVDVDLAVTLHPDDTLDGTLVVAVSEDFAAGVGMKPSELVDLGLLSITDDPDEHTTVTAFSKDGWVGSTVSVKNGPLNVFGGDEGSLQIVRDGDEFVVSGNLDFSDSLTAVFAPGGDTSQTDDLQARIAVTFPGPVTESNGEVSGSTVTWTAKKGDVVEVSARGAAVESSGIPLVVVGAVVAVLLAVVVTVVLVRRRRPAPGAGAVPDDATPPTEPIPTPVSTVTSSLGLAGPPPVVAPRSRSDWPGGDDTPDTAA